MYTTSIRESDEILERDRYAAFIDYINNENGKRVSAKFSINFTYIANNKYAAFLTFDSMNLQIAANPIEEILIESAGHKIIIYRDSVLYNDIKNFIATKAAISVGTQCTVKVELYNYGFYSPYEEKKSMFNYILQL